MVAKTSIPQVQRALSTFPISDYRGLNRFSIHSALKPGEMRLCYNLDLYKDGYMKGRAGSSILNAVANILDSYDVLNGVRWKTDTAEYAVLQGVQGSASYFITLQLEVDAAFSVVNNYAAAAFSVAGQVDPMEMCISGGRCMAFGTSGNAIIDFIDGTFKARTLGLSPIKFDKNNPITFDDTTRLTIGKWTLGVELVYRKDGADYLSSGISRLYSDGKKATAESAEGVGHFFAALDPTSISYPAGIEINDGTFENGMFVRLWQSKNQAPVSTNVLDVVDTEGLEDELYPFFIIPLYYVINGGGGYVFTPYVIAILVQLDSELPNLGTGSGVLPRSNLLLATLDYLDLEPLPAAACGCHLRGRIFVGNCPDVDPGGGKVYNSKLADTPFSEAYKQTDFTPCDPGDGQKVVYLGKFGKDLLILKEGQTGRMIDADPNNGYDPIDTTIGLSHLKLVSMVPGFGAIAITGEEKDARILGYDLTWRTLLGDAEIARKVREITTAMAAAPEHASFAYVHGKLWLSPGDGTVLILHVEQERGWTMYSYALGGELQLLLPFENNSRLAALGRGRCAVELDVGTTDVDVNGAPVDIEEQWMPHRFQSGEGRHLLEFQEYSVVAELSNPLYAVPYSNGRQWPSGLDSEQVPFTPEPAQYTDYPELQETNYRLGLKLRPVGNFLHFLFRTTGPCTIRSQQLSAYVQTEVRQDFDPFQILRFKKVQPVWTSRSLLEMVFDRPGPDVVDYSGWARHHTWDDNNGAGKYAFLPDVPAGQYIGGNGLKAATYRGVEYIGDDDTGVNSRARTWLAVFRVPGALVNGNNIAEGGKLLDDAPYWRLYLQADGSAVFELGALSAAYSFTCPAASLIPDALYAFVFVLTNGGLNGQFYIAALSATSFPGAIVTTRAALVRTAPPVEVHTIGRNANLDLVRYRALVGDFSETDAKRFWMQEAAA